MRWTVEAWTEALTAMRERASVAEILALHEAGAISKSEILSGAWEVCHSQPTLRAELVRQFRNHPDEDIAQYVGRCLEELAAQT